MLRDLNHCVSCATERKEGKPTPGPNNCLVEFPTCAVLDSPHSKSIPLPSQLGNMASKEIGIHPVLQGGYLFDLSAEVPVDHTYSVDAATDPALPSLAIWIPYIPWPVVVHSAFHDYVTVFDVLAAIYDALRLPAWSVTNDTEALWILESRNTKKMEKRIHLLEGRHYFAGLESSCFGAETLVMKVQGKCTAIERYHNAES